MLIKKKETKRVHPIDHNAAQNVVCTRTRTRKLPSAVRSLGILPHSLFTTSFLPVTPTFDDDAAKPSATQGARGRPSTFNVTTEALNLAKEICGITPAKAAFGSVNILLTMIRVRFLPFFDHGDSCLRFSQESVIN